MGLNEYESKETIFKVIYSEEIDKMRRETEQQWNINNLKTNMEAKNEK